MGGLHVLQAVLLDLVILLGEPDVAVDVKRGLTGEQV